MRSSSTDQAKQEIRTHIWALLEQEGAALPPGATGRIPNFVGAERAAALLAEISAWQVAGVIKANPDRAQLPVRARALADGKQLYMAVPRLAELRPFVLLDPAHLDSALGIAAQQAAAKDHALAVGRRVAVGEMPPVDLVVCGSVAVNRQGARIGKGAGFSDIEVALLHDAGLIGPQTVLVTTVHQLQVVDGALPETDHDFRVDVIATPEEVIWCPSHPPPPGLLWDHLGQAKIAEIPALASLHAAGRSPS